MVKSEPALFAVLRPSLAAGHFPAEKNAVLTYSLWQSMFHGDRRAVGSVIQAGSESYRVAAVLDGISSSYRANRPST